MMAIPGKNFDWGGGSQAGIIPPPSQIELGLAFPSHQTEIPKEPLPPL